MPIIGFLSSQSPETVLEPLRGFRRGLKEFGYVEGENVAIDYRFAQNQINRLPELAAELIGLRATSLSAIAMSAPVTTAAVTTAAVTTATVTAMTGAVTTAMLSNSSRI
jgi:putative tryptophan/tyrosine transport system substrate-binding protein